MGQKIKRKWFWRKKKDGTRGIPLNQIGAKNEARDIIVRAAKTFLQAFLASLVVDITSISSGGWNVCRSALISAAAAGLSAVMNLAIAALGREVGDYDIQTASDETGEWK